MKAKKAAESCRDPFSSLESEPNRIAVADHGKNSRERAAKIDKLRSRLSVLGDHHSHCHSSQAFSEIYDKHRITKPFTQDARHVGCSDISATNFAHIDPTNAARNVTRWNRAEEIGK